MKWIFALNERSNANYGNDSYELMAQVAVYSAKMAAPLLEPYLLWSGKENEFTGSMRRLGVTVIPHTISISDSIDSAQRPEDWRHIAKGVILRLDIPTVFSSSTEQILYTDVDTMFLDDPSNYKFDKPLFAFSSEFNYDNFERINSGVMILNLEGARHAFPSFISWTKQNLDWIPDYDQGAIQTFFNGRWDKLDQRMNWKPYWNRSENPIVVHFHGPEPTDFDPITLRPKFDPRGQDIYAQLYRCNTKAYREYVSKWVSIANDYFCSD